MRVPSESPFGYPISLTGGIIDEWSGVVPIHNSIEKRSPKTGSMRGFSEFLPTLR
jgi:hypothetical protein